MSATGYSPRKARRNILVLLPLLAFLALATLFFFRLGAGDPSHLRAGLLSIWVSVWNSLARLSSPMPMPPSVTRISRNSVNSLSANAKVRRGQVPSIVPTALRGTYRARSVTRPPGSLNFTAFETRLTTICLVLCTSRSVVLRSP